MDDDDSGCTTGLIVASGRDVFNADEGGMNAVLAVVDGEQGAAIFG
jgi:hypothetical protein